VLCTKVHCAEGKEKMPPELSNERISSRRRRKRCTVLNLKSFDYSLPRQGKRKASKFLAGKADLKLCIDKAIF